MNRLEQISAGAVGFVLGLWLLGTLLGVLQ